VALRAGWGKSKKMQTSIGYVLDCREARLTRGIIRRPDDYSYGISAQMDYASLQLNRGGVTRTPLEHFERLLRSWIRKVTCVHATPHRTGKRWDGQMLRTALEKCCKQGLRKKQSHGPDVKLIDRHLGRKALHPLARRIDRVSDTGALRGNRSSRS